MSHPVKRPRLVKRLLPLVTETACAMLLMGRGITLILVIKHKERHNALKTKSIVRYIRMGMSRASTIQSKVLC